MDDLSLLLKLEYGIAVKSILPVEGGFSTKAAYHVTGVNGAEYFLKLYDKSQPTTRFWVDRIDTYMPVLNWLSARPSLHGRILTPVSSLQDNAYRAEAGNDVYVLFIFVRGRMPGIGGMTYEQTKELAEILAVLHEVDKIPFETPGLEEDISLPFCEQLEQYLSKTNRQHDALYNLVHPHTEMLLAAIRETLRLRDTVRTGYSPLVLCHGDAHGNNVIQGERLVLVDWETLHRAPTEADLFIHAWHPHGETLLETYSAARRGYRINRELLRFYTLRRRIEDVWVDIQRLIEENPDDAERVDLLDWLSIGIEEIRKIYSTGG
ncbi:MAG: aminoglycoside phosphotransferase family protein [Oscillospiraceae bacterium]|nr:aminoglycoside phosphotransferase family protein [Oscillospiraceae bacterium]